MFDAILWGVLLFLLIDRLLFMQGSRDKLARKAIRQLAKKELNREVAFYPFSREVGIYTDSIAREMKKIDEKYEDQQNIVDDFKAYTSQEISKLRDEAKKGDETIVAGVSALAEHLGVEIKPYHKPEERGLRITKIKKTRKSKK